MNVGTITTTPLDFAYDEDSVEQAIERVHSLYDVRIDVVEENGPGGGWPVVTVTGDASDVALFISDAYDSGDAQQNFETLLAALGAPRL